MELSKREIMLDKKVVATRPAKLNVPKGIYHTRLKDKWRNEI